MFTFIEDQLFHTCISIYATKYQDYSETIIYVYIERQIESQVMQNIII